MKKGRVLVVVSDAIVADDVSSILQDIGYEVTAMVPSGEQAVERAAKDSPDLVLMDVVLRREMDGIEAAEQIRSRSHIPVVYLTPYVDHEFKERAEATHPYNYILKPFGDEDLSNGIEAILG
ncbi:MAG: response regulator [Chloroflexota bacterium]